MDDIERSMRAARPQLGHRDDALSARAERDLDAILTGTARAPRARRRMWPIRIAGLAVPIAAITAAATVVTVVFTPQPSVAAPPPLEYHAIDESYAEVMTRLSDAARTLPTPEGRVVQYEGWFANIEIDETETRHFVQPEQVTRVVNDDLSGTFTTRAGAVRWGTPSEDNPAREPGSLIDESVFGPGEFPLAYPTTPPPTDAADYPDYLALAGWTADATPGELFGAVTEVANEWPLDGAQTSAMIDFLATLPDVSVAGRVTDRLGRSGIAIQTQTRLDGAFLATLVFDDTTGRLLSSEDVYMGGLEELKIPAPMVFSYIAWREHPE